MGEGNRILSVVLKSSRLFPCGSEKRALVFRFLINALPGSERVEERKKPTANVVLQCGRWEGWYGVEVKQESTSAYSIFPKRGAITQKPKFGL